MSDKGGSQSVVSVHPMNRNIPGKAICQSEAQVKLNLTRQLLNERLLSQSIDHSVIAESSAHISAGVQLVTKPVAGSVQV
mmetsp:Transcript_1425/g.1943  ORF Transcript_1425/g.1943 Transcript_1425/m.1943 type:complete len:80 (-) Transcript_1425:174-413(-)